MAYTIPTCEPAELRIGAAWAWDVAYPDHPSDDGWTLAYSLRGPDDLDLAFGTEVAAADSGIGFSVRVPRATTAGLTDRGAYRLIGQVFKANDPADGRVVYDGHVLMHPDPSTAVGEKSFNRQRLEALQAAAVTNGGYRETMINGRRIVFAPEEYQRQLAHFSYLVALEENPDARIEHHAEFVRG